jgi:hypothetical protein
VACTTAEGRGGPPKCPEGSAHGTLLTRFDVVQCEGGWSQAEHLATTVERWITPEDAAAPASASLYLPQPRSHLRETKARDGDDLLP